MSLFLYICLLFISAIIAGFLVIYSLSKKPAAGSVDMAILMFLVMIWCSASIFEAVSQTVEGKFLWSIFSYIGSQPFTGVVLLFALRYTGRDKKLTPFRIGMLFIFPIIIIVLAITNPWHRLLWPNITLRAVPGGVAGVFEHGMFFWLSVIYNYTIAIWAIFLLCRYFLFSRDVSVPKRSKELLIASLCPIAANLVYAFAPDLLGGFDPTPLSFTAMNFLLAMASFRFRFLDLVPVAWERVINTFDDGVLALDHSHRIVGWNPRLEKWLGLAPENRGWEYEKAFLDWPQLIQLIENTETGSKALALITRDQEERIMEVRVTPFSNYRGQINGKIVIFQDVTEQKTIQRELENARNQAEAANRAKSDFLAAMSHELRNPLQGISGIVFLLSKTPLDFEQKQQMERLESAMRTLSGIINNILDFSKIESGKLSLDAVDFNLRLITQDVFYLFDSLATEKGLRMELKIEDSLPVDCNGDPLRVKQILINLVSNAVKFTPSGGHIAITARGASHEEEGKRTAFFEVADTGMGIPEEKGKHLFDPFYQGDAAVARQFGGTGLGLTIAKDLVEKMGGQITFESRLGFGTIFAFKLRLTPALSPATIEPKEGEPNSRLFCKNVLYVEDNAVNRMILTEILTSFGMGVSAVSSGKAAFEEAKKNVYDLMITDIFLPDMEGYELTLLLRGVLPKLWPIIALTGNGSQEARDKALKAGMDSFLVKPVSPNVLREEISRLLGDAGSPVSGKSASEIAPAMALSEPLPGIDKQSALELVGGDLDIYREALKLFVLSIRNLDKSFGDSLRRGCFSDAGKTLHRTKGAAMAIGANAFARSCAELEKTLEEQMPESLEPTLDLWLRQLNQLLGSKEIEAFIREGSQ